MENYKKCRVKNCENNAYWKEGGIKKYCSKHYAQINRNSKILERTRFDLNEIINCGDYYEICLYSGCGEQTEVARALIDKEDLKKVKNYKWHINCGYVITIKNKKNISLHQLILGETPMGYEIDHKFGDILDNRKCNLRFVTDSQNSMNRKNVKGYCWNKNRKKWQAYIKINQKLIHLGRFLNKQDAIKIRKEAESKYFGEFAYRDN